MVSSRRTCLVISRATSIYILKLEDLPVDELHVEDLAGTMFVGRGDDSHRSEVRGHGEVGDCANEKRNCEEVVKYLLAATSEVGKADNNEERNRVESSNRP